MISSPHIILILTLCIPRNKTWIKLLFTNIYVLLTYSFGLHISFSWLDRSISPVGVTQVWSPQPGSCYVFRLHTKSILCLYKHIHPFVSKTLFPLHLIHLLTHLDLTYSSYWFTFLPLLTSSETASLKCSQYNRTKWNIYVVKCLGTICQRLGGGWKSDRIQLSIVYATQVN